MQGVVFYEGPSMLDGKPIVAIATPSTENRKTGDMIQTWILRRNIDPVRALAIEVHDRFGVDAHSTRDPLFGQVGARFGISRAATAASTAGDSTVMNAAPNQLGSNGESACTPPSAGASPSLSAPCC